MAYYLSAYAIAVAHGFRGSEEEWLASLRGAPGKSAYEVAVECGYQGTKEEWLETLKGQSDLPVAAAAAPTGYDTYAAAGDNLPVVEKATQQQEAVGVGKQIVFLPNHANLTTAPVLKLNNGETVEIRLRADGETADTVPVPVGTLKAGVPVTLTFGGTYWLVDSAIGGLGGGNAERVELTQPVTIGETECDNVQDALEAAADALEGKIDEEDVEEIPFVTASDALSEISNDEAPITPAGVKRIVDEYGGDAQNIKVYDLDSVSSTALAALSDDPKTAVFLAYNVAEFEEEEDVYPYGNKLLLLPLSGFESAPLIGSLNAVFEQDADLVRYSDDDPPVAQTVRKTVRVSISRANGSTSDIKTVEIVPTEIDRICPEPIKTTTNASYTLTVYSFDASKTYHEGDLVLYGNQVTALRRCSVAEHTGEWDASHFPKIDGDSDLFQIADGVDLREYIPAILAGNAKLYFDAKLGSPFILPQACNASVGVASNREYVQVIFQNVLGRTTLVFLTLAFYLDDGEIIVRKAECVP